MKLHALVSLVIITMKHNSYSGGCYNILSDWRKRRDGEWCWTVTPVVLQQITIAPEEETKRIHKSILNPYQRYPGYVCVCFCTLETRTSYEAAYE